MATAKTEQKPENEKPVKKSSGGSGILVLVLNLVNLIATIGMIGILYVSFQREKSTTSVEDIAVQETMSHEFESKNDSKNDNHSDSHSATGEATKKKSLIDTKMVTLDSFTINLSTPGSAVPKFVRVNVSIEVQNTDTEQEVNTKIPQIRNTIIDLFNSKRPADLANVDGRDYLKEEIKNAINSFLLSGKIKGIFFTNFALST